MPFDDLTPERACEALAALGLRITPSDVDVERRERRWLVRLPGDRLAWLAASVPGREGMATERRVLRLLAERCSFGVPRVLAESPDGDIDVRSMVPGVVDAWATFARARDDPALAARLGAALGAILAEQHTRVRASDVAGWLPPVPSWPEPGAWVRERLPDVVDDPRLLDSALALVERYESLAIAEEDRALVHADLGFHNMVVDPASSTVLGVFDYDGAAWADRHHDFRYLVFDAERFEMLESAIATYESLSGRPISRPRVRLYNAVCAISFLAYRAGTRPEERSCGRTLEEDLRWTRAAIAAARSAV